MGAAIFRLVSSRPFDITLLAIDREEAERHEEKYQRALKRASRREGLSDDEFRKRRESVRFTHRIEDLSSCEMVIEAIFEDFDEKAAIFRELESVVDKNTILVSNTSSISIKELAEGARIRGSFLWIAFFSSGLAFGIG